MILPIELHPHEVTAIFEGRQHQLRRPINPQPFQGWSDSDIETRFMHDGLLELGSVSQIVNGAWSAGFIDVESVYGRIGDLLWAQETWGKSPDGPIYRATELEPVDERRWMPSIEMPSWISRLTLLVKDVRIDRLHDISEQEAMVNGADLVGVETGRLSVSSAPEEVGSYRAGYYELWNSINAERGYEWDANPWVWVIDFMAFPRNVDQVQPGAAA
ncbi:MAG: hypothetical protein SV201_05795 [Pseudomonadota bacterium]|nr:hypothetical protein [Pseudomonadota bacterium]